MTQYKKAAGSGQFVVAHRTDDCHICLGQQKIKGPQYYEH